MCLVDNDSYLRFTVRSLVKMALSSSLESKDKLMWVLSFSCVNLPKALAHVNACPTLSVAIVLL